MGGGRGQGGVTLIELLVVLAVLGVLAGIVVVSLGGTTAEATRVACVHEAVEIHTALERYRLDNDDAYPPASPGLAVLASLNYLSATPDHSKWAYDGTLGTVVGVGGCSAPGHGTAGHGPQDCSFNPLVSSGYNNFSRCDLNSVEWDGVQVPGDTFVETNLSAARFGGAAFTHADLSFADLSDIYLDGADLSNTTLVGTNFSGALIHDVNFTGATGLTPNQLETVAGRYAAQVYLVGLDLTGQNLSGFTSEDQFSGGPVRGRQITEDVNLSRSILVGTDLSHSSFGAPSSMLDANFTEADLSFSSMTYAEFDGSNLSRVNLSGTDLTDSSLADADLTDANLSGVNLTGANLTGANLTGANLAGAIFFQTTCPENGTQISSPQTLSDC
jgi:prepilin-type N-terminal cleavage/methylation domain-containing protein